MHYSIRRHLPTSFPSIAVICSCFLRIVVAHAGVLDDSGGGASKSAPDVGSAPAASAPDSLQPNPLESSASKPSGSQPCASPQSKQLQPVSVPSASNDPYDKLALALAQASGSDGTLYVSIGNFLDGDTDQLSPRSTELKEELAISLPKTGKFEIITRERLADLQNEGKFQNSDIVQTASGSDQVGVKAVNGIIRGRISSKSPDTIVYAEIAYLNGGEIRKVKAVIPSAVADPSRKNLTDTVPKLSQTDKTYAQQDGKGGKQRQENKNGAAPAQAKLEGKKNPKAKHSEHPFVKRIEKREQRLENQLKRATAAGLIKPKEAAEIRDDIQKIKRQENRFLLQNDGFLTKSERDQLNGEEDQLDQQIRKDKKSKRRN